MGSLIQRESKAGPVWYAVYRVAGKQTWKRTPKHYGPGKRAAARFLVECEAAAAVATTGQALFATIAATWLAAQKTRVKRTSYATYETALRRHLMPHFGDRAVGDITPAEVQDWLSEADVSASYLRNKLVPVLRQIFDMAVRHELLHRSPAKGRLVFPREEKKDVVRALTGEQVRTILEHTAERWIPVFTTCVFTGMRIGEVLAMRWRHLDADQRRYNVEETLTQDCQFQPPKNEASQRDVPLAPYVVRVLEEQRAQVAQERLEADAWEDHDLIFPGRLGRPQRHRTAYRAWLRAIRLVGLPGYRIHDLRHTCASLLIAAGADAKTVSRQLRHSSITTTLDTYGHLYPERQDEAIEMLEKMIGVGS